MREKIEIEESEKEGGKETIERKGGMQFGEIAKVQKSYDKRRSTTKRERY